MDLIDDFYADIDREDEYADGEEQSADSEDSVPYGIDEFLQAFVIMANEGPLSLGVALTVGGQTVVGDLASGREYAAAVADKITYSASKGNSELQERIRAACDDLASLYPDLHLPTEEQLTELDYTNTYYVHLKNAAFRDTSGGLIPVGGIGWWRGKLESIDGFVLTER